MQRESAHRGGEDAAAQRTETGRSRNLFAVSPFMRE